MPHAALCVVQRTFLKGEYGLIEVSMPHAALWVVQPLRGAEKSVQAGSFNSARGFVGGAALHGGRHALFTASFNAARGYSLSPPPPLRGPPPPLAQGRLFVYGMPASLPDARDAGCCKVPSQREGATVF